MILILWDMVKVDFGVVIQQFVDILHISCYHLIDMGIDEEIKMK